MVDVVRIGGEIGEEGLVVERRRRLSASRYMVVLDQETVCASR